MTSPAELDSVPDAQPAPAGALDPAEPIGSLSPSRAADFKTCPLMYRLRTIDRLPEPPSLAATRGTLVHAVLENLFDQPAPERTLERARELLPEAWQRVLREEPAVAELFAGEAEGDAGAEAGDGDESAAGGGSAGGVRFAEWMASAAALLGNYFELEDPSRLEPFAREQLVEVVVDGLKLRGYIDRIDRSPAGDLRVVDYKTGATPREAFEGKALFQMKFYALVLWRTRGAVPRQLRLIYLSDTDTLTYEPDQEELERFERTLKAIWAAIQRATDTGDFRASPSRLCEWCSFQAYCPAFGGQTPPFPSAEQRVAMADARRAALAADPELKDP